MGGTRCDLQYASHDRCLVCRVALVHLCELPLSCSRVLDPRGTGLTFRQSRRHGLVRHMHCHVDLVWEPLYHRSDLPLLHQALQGDETFVDGQIIL